MSKSISEPSDGAATLSYKCRLVKQIVDTKELAQKLTPADPVKAQEVQRLVSARAAYFKSLFGF
jgi:hypothetical protein